MKTEQEMQEIIAAFDAKIAAENETTGGSAKLAKWIHPTTGEIRLYFNEKNGNVFDAKIWITDDKNYTKVSYRLPAGAYDDASKKETIYKIIDGFINGKSFSELLKIAEKNEILTN